MLHKDDSLGRIIKDIDPIGGFLWLTQNAAGQSIETVLAFDECKL